MKEHAYPVAPVQVSQAEEYSAWFTLLRAFNAGIGPDRPYAFLGMDKVTAGSTSTAATLPEDANSHKPNRVQIQVGDGDVYFQIDDDVDGDSYLLKANQEYTFGPYESDFTKIAFKRVGGSDVSVYCLFDRQSTLLDGE
jgi:hypothetical protein